MLKTPYACPIADTVARHWLFSLFWQRHSSEATFSDAARATWWKA